MAMVKGSRTVAGSMVFTVLNRDVWANLFQLDKSEALSHNPYTVDQIPPFNITITAINEQPGYACSQAILGVRLCNFGTTYSVDDLILESTYSYQAEAITPFLPMRATELLRHSMRFLKPPPTTASRLMFDAIRKVD